METDYTATMNREAYDLWLAALESGEYPQGQSTMNGEGKFCCLGVLCEVAVKAGADVSVSEPDDYDVIRYDGNGANLPDSVVVWSGLDWSDPLLGSREASAWNDAADKTFPEIAALIRTYVRPVDPESGE